MPWVLNVASSSRMRWIALWGGVSRPSVKAWMKRRSEGRPRSAAILMRLS